MAISSRRIKMLPSNLKCKRTVGLSINGDRLFPDETIKPRSVNGIFLKGRSLEELHQVFDGGTDVTTYIDFLQSWGK